MLLPRDIPRTRKCVRVIKKRIGKSFGRASEAKLLETFTKRALSMKSLSKKHRKHEIWRAPKSVTVLGKRLRKGFGKGFSSKLLETAIEISSPKATPSKHSCSGCFRRICQHIKSIIWKRIQNLVVFLQSKLLCKTFSPRGPPMPFHEASKLDSKTL